MSSPTSTSYTGIVGDSNINYSASSYSQPARMSPIRNLPPELLIDIFVYCSEQPSVHLTPVILGQVCRWWKNICNTSPRIWQHIYLYESNETSISHDQAFWWMYKSSPLTFDVHIDASTTEMILPLLSPVLSQMQRLRWCIISGRHHEEFDFAKYAFGRTRNCFVDDLQILIKGVSALDTLGLNTDSNVSDDRSVSNVFRVHSQSDGTSELSLHFTLYALPLQSMMKPVPIKSLYITECSLDVSTDVVRLLDFLKCTPLLETLHFAGWPQEGKPIQPGQLHLVKLAHLRSLVIRSTVSVRPILSYIDAPSLEELYLEHTNVDFELRTDPYVMQQPEDGDSEDEAHDFSQSPWSDHATGMGLRTLLKRSRPPLLLLHMDYADMRTKDFRWCFDHLEHLREFQIVGSDMSDRVVAMLAPYRRRLLAFGLANPRDVEDPRGSWAVRLPNLRKLMILNCQRVSGDAVVQVLRERVSFTDRAAEEGRGETLESVAVVGCTEFMFRHRQALREALGERARTT